MSVHDGWKPGDGKESMVRAILLISGRVQGVFYRATALQTAQQLGLTGWVRNLPDGGVEAVVEGGKDAVDDFVGWCRLGPSASRVDEVDLAWSAATGEFSTFRVVG